MVSFPGEKGNLYASTLFANLASIAVGTHYSWSSPTIPKLQEAGSWINITDEQASWIGALVAFGTGCGPYVGGALVNRIGRRWTMFTSVVVNIIAWIVIFFSQTVWEIYVGRILGGIAGGITCLTIPTYVAEISVPDVRAALGSLFAFFLVGGYLVEYVVGPFVSYAFLIFVNIIPSIIFFIAFVILPESPYYSVRKDDTDTALKALTWLRTGRSQEEVEKELAQMQSEVKKSLSESAKLSDLFSTKGNRKALWLSCCMFAGQQMSGVNVVLAFAQEIFIMAGTSFSPSISTIVIGVILFGFRGFAAPLVRYFGMKNVLIGSATGITIFQFLLGLFFYFSQTEDMSSYDWLPVTSLVGYILCLTVGFGPLPWAVMAEVFPPNIKAMASAICASFCWFTAFILTKFFNNISDVLGPQYAFFFFSLCGFLALLFAIFILPDTRGMKLQEILDMLNS